MVTQTYTPGWLSDLKRNQNSFEVLEVVVVSGGECDALTCNKYAYNCLRNLSLFLFSNGLCVYIRIPKKSPPLKTALKSRPIY